ncbi:MAG: helix-turn-helix domain-containing protein [Bdellovibrionota bacterium]
MKVHKWENVKKRFLSPEDIREVDRQVREELLKMDLRELRKALGKTQQEMAKIARMTQSEVSRLERRGDHRLSTLRHVVESLGGELEVIAKFGKKRVRLHAAG